MNVGCNALQILFDEIDFRIYLMGKGLEPDVAT